MWYKWFFDGIGSSVFSLVVGAIIGSFTGYKIGINKKIKLKQKSGNFSEQNQMVQQDDESCDTGTSSNLNISLKQKAKNNAKQMQNGDVSNERG